MSGKERQAISYLLRLWPTRTRGELVWRASLESARTGERQGFAGLDGLFAFLEQEIRGAAGSQTAPHACEKKGGDCN